MCAETFERFLLHRYFHAVFNISYASYYPQEPNEQILQSSHPSTLQYGEALVFFVRHVLLVQLLWVASLPVATPTFTAACLPPRRAMGTLDS